MTSPVSAFALPDRLSAKRDPALIGIDDHHFSTIRTSLDRSVAELEDRLDAERRAPGGSGQQALERDLEIHRLTARLRTLRRYRLDLTLGRMTQASDGAPVYVGRLGLVDADGGRLLVDWRSPAAEPFFGATLAQPMGLASRRRYRWSGGLITDYWDEAFTEEAFDGNAALDDQSAFIASLGSSRSPRMRDVLGTLQADQDAIIRAAADGALVVDGGPGTGKTVVALHRAAYLLYSDPRISRGDRGVLFVGPSEGYLGYIEDVLPSLGEDGVQTCILAELVVEGAVATKESDTEVARLKSSLAMVDAIEAAVAWYERPPRRGLVVETEWADVELDAGDWAEAFDSAEPGATHNEARDQVWERLLDLIVDRHDEEVPEELVRRSIERNADLRATFARAWPVLDPVGVVADLWSVPAYLQRCAPTLSADDIRALQRTVPRAWTTADLPLLDAARSRIGDPDESHRRRERSAALRAQREEMEKVIEHLIESDDSELQLMSMLRRQDFGNSLVDESEVRSADPDALAGPFAHVVVDEAQELTDAEWQMLLRRCPSRSFTIVGDRAQARAGFPESWQERLLRIGLEHVSESTLSINYRTPEEVMGEAEPVIRAALPDANVPVSIRASGIPVLHAPASKIAGVLAEWEGENAEGTACVIGSPAFVGSARVRSLSPEDAKGLEFDLVVLVDPEQFSAVDRYVAMTRATQRLVILASPTSHP